MNVKKTKSSKKIVLKITMSMTVIHGINDITTMQLEEQPTLNTLATEYEMRHTKRPSASHWFKGNTTYKMREIALESRRLSYPVGPGGYPSLAGNSRLSMYSMDKTCKPIPRGIVKNKNRATVWATSAHLMPVLVIGGVKQHAHTLKEQTDDNP